MNSLYWPWQNPFAPGVALLLGVLFGGAGVALLVVGLVRRAVTANGNSAAGRPTTSQQVLWQRYRTWALLAPVFALAALSGPIGLAMLSLLIGVIGAGEYTRLMDLPSAARYTLIAGSTLTAGATLLWGQSALLAGPVIAFFAWTGLGMLPLTETLEERGRLVQHGLWGYLYLGWLPAHLVGLGSGRLPGLVLAVGLGVALSDVGAFCAGKALGGPKLAPRLSPNKTWGGVAGNLLGAALAVLLTAFALPGLAGWQAGALALVIGLGSVWGDLLESLLKRQQGVKDAGRLLPGFGGLLDRVDSLLMVAPLVYYFGFLILGFRF